MRTSHWSQLLVAGFVALSLTACSQDKDDGGKKAQPQTPEEALQNLPEYHRAAFETWKKQVAKSCAAAEALGLASAGGSTEVGVDAKALIARNAGSLVFTSTDATLFLTGLQSLSGQSTTETEASSEVDGVTTSVSAKTERSGSRCSLFIYGQKVYETTLAQNFVVGAELRADKRTAPLPTRVRIEDVGSIGSAAAADTGVSESLMEMLKPTAVTRDQFAAALGVDATQAQRLFVLSPYPQITFALRMAQEVSAVWSTGDERKVVASRAALNSTFGGDSRTFPVDLRLKLPAMKFVDQENSADRVSFAAQALFVREATGAGSTLRMEGVRIAGRQAYEAAAAEGCLNDRIATYFVSAQGRNALTPGLDFALAPCRVLNPGLEEAAFKSGSMARHFATMYAGVSPSHVFQHNGWENVVRRLVIETLDAGMSLTVTLDPQNLTRVVPMLQSTTSVIRGELPRMQNGPALKEALDLMAIEWALRGQQVELSQIGRIIYSVDIAANPFLTSSRNLIGTLGIEPYARDRELGFALSLSAEYKTQASEALVLANEVEEKHFEREIFNVVLQKQIPLSEIQNYAAALKLAKNELAKYPSLKPVQSQMSSLTTTWIRNGAFTATEIPAVYQAVANVVAEFPASTAAMLKSLDAQAGDRAALAYARELTAVTKAQALQIVRDSAAAGFANWGQDFVNTILQRRPSPAQIRDWASMWTGINAFVARETQRLAGESAIGAEWRRKSLIDRAIKENWTELEFQGLESIAPLAVHKTMCERHKDISSLADCAGGSLFSRNARMFFDPTFHHRYTGLAATLNSALARMTDFNWTSLKGEIVREFFGSFEPLWSRCDQAGFHQRAAELKGALDQALAETDSFRRFEHERRIRDLIRNCR